MKNGDVAIMEQMAQIDQSLQEIREVGQQVLDYHASVLDRVERLHREILDLKQQAKKRKVNGR